MPETDLIGGAGETVDIDTLAQNRSGSPDDDNGAETPASSGQSTDGGEAASEAPGGADAQGTRTVPEKAFARVYGESKAKDREIERLRAQLARPASAPAPATPVASGSARPEVKFLQDSMAPVVGEAVKAALAPFEARERVNEAKNKLSDFWTSNPDFVGYKDKLDAVFMTAVQEGNDPAEVSPEMILNALIGQEHRTQVQARRSIARESQARQTRVNEAAATTTAGSRPAAGSGGQTGAGGSKKKFSDMSASEIEKDYGSIVIWRKGLHQEDE